MRSDSTQDVARGDAQRQAAEAVRLAERYHHQAIVSKSRGQRDFSRDQLRRAVESCSEALRLDPHQASVYLYRARILEELGEEELAEADLEMAQRLTSAN